MLLFFFFNILSVVIICASSATILTGLNLKILNNNVKKKKNITHLTEWKPRKVCIGLLTKQQPPTQKSIILHATIQTKPSKCNLLKYNCFQQVQVIFPFYFYFLYI
jgi:hypothetical protein